MIHLDEPGIFELDAADFASYENSESIAFLKVVKLLACSSGDLRHGPLNLGKGLRVMKDGALRMVCTPQATGIGIRKGVHNIDVDQTE